MIEGVTEAQDVAKPEAANTQSNSDKALNFRRLEAAKEQEREARIRAELQAEQLRKEVDAIKQMLTPQEKDPLDDMDGYVEPAMLRAKLEKERAAYERRAEEIARKTYEEHKKRDYESNYMQRLKQEFSDFDQVMTQDNLVLLEEADPVFVEAVLDNPDEYKRRKMAYLKVKSLKSQAKKVEEPSIRQTVEENARNPFHIPSGSGTPTAIEFDVRSKSAREAAYAKLKAAQRRPIGGQGPNG